MPKDARRMAVNFAKLPEFDDPRGEALAFAKEVAAQPRFDPRGQTAPRPRCRGTSTRNNIGRRNTLSIKAVRSSSSTLARDSTMKWSGW
jgi:hypothetical protein